MYESLSTTGSMSSGGECDSAAAEHDGSGGGSGWNGTRELRIAFLGRPRVGKSAIVRQFAWSEFDSAYSPGSGCAQHRKAVSVNGRLYDVVLRDCSGVGRFPRDAADEWMHYRGYGLRAADAYVLVYDASNEETFDYVRSMRDQILRCRGPDAPMVVVGAKLDLYGSGGYGVGSGSGSGALRPAVAQASHRAACFSRDIQLLAKKWKCPFVACSAKYNWHINALVEETLKAAETQACDARQTPGRRRVHEVWRKHNCVVL